ncbi:hypothetical protein M422DRAFT_188781 [Sphaerobolus stellatus SS14]|uniref:Major facilitator superfamily (MFS) profile domain-containing protein n=1 Tax=Sphaerobolus stellatus (strain SS14) TaxID=990650 RepID=A0A0C9UVL2_SPHS4|nr:hypothetical protein M422DRAFT_188781 [Sphaerobolus stellatus SS14]
MNSSETTSETPTLEIVDPTLPSPPKSKKGSAFWFSFLAVVVSTFLSALDLTAVSTAIPTIADQLNGGENYVWIGSAYALSSTAILPLSGSLADIFGRKPIMLLSIAFFAVGSAIGGASQNINMIIAARTIQGIGGGGILNLSEIITSDLVSLAERGLYQGMLGLTWSFASGIGPPIGGALAEKASWRWLFYLNLPLSGMSFVLVIIFLRVKRPEGSISEKLSRVDWFGNLLVICGTTLAVIGLTWGGSRYPWDSPKVLAPLIIGLALIGAFILYEAKVPKEPTIPWEVISHRVSFSGYWGTFVHGITSITIIYYLPVYFQSALLSSPLRSAVQMLATALIIAPLAFAAGVIVQVSKRYIPVNVAGWILTIVGFGVMSLLSSTSSTAQWVGYQLIASAGTGIIYSSTLFPVLAPQPVTRSASALGFYSFIRSFAQASWYFQKLLVFFLIWIEQAWGITLSSTVLQNQLKKNLPEAFLTRFPEGLQIAFAAIPQIKGLPEPLRTQVRVAFSNSMSTVWKVMIGISGLGLLSVLLLKEIALKETTNENYGLKDDTKEKQGGTETTVVLV